MTHVNNRSPNMIFADAILHWPNNLISTEHTTLHLVRTGGDPLMLSKDELPASLAITRTTYSLEAVGEVYYMAYDPITDHLFVQVEDGT